MNKKETRFPISTTASATLRNPNASTIQKALAGSALAQTNTKKETSYHVVELASKALKSKKYNALTQQLAGSVLSQSKKKRME